MLFCAAGSMKHHGLWLSLSTQCFWLLRLVRTLAAFINSLLDISVCLLCAFCAFCAALYVDCQMCMCMCTQHIGTNAKGYAGLALHYLRGVQVCGVKAC